jgi:hypothetical protein
MAGGAQTQRIAVILTPWTNVGTLGLGVLRVGVEKYSITDT